MTPSRIITPVTFAEDSYEAAREQRADLIVVPIHRESELAHLVHDHADRYVLHHTDVPVLVVPTGGRDVRHVNGGAPIG